MSLHKARITISRDSTLHGALQEFELPNRRRLNIDNGPSFSSPSSQPSYSQQAWLSPTAFTSTSTSTSTCISVNRNNDSDIPEFIKFDHKRKNGQGLNVSLILQHATSSKLGELAREMEGAYDQVFGTSTSITRIELAVQLAHQINLFYQVRLVIIIVIPNSPSPSSPPPLVPYLLTDSSVQYIIHRHQQHAYKDPHYTRSTPDLKLGLDNLTLDRLVLVGFHRVSHGSNTLNRWRLDLAYDYPSGFTIASNTGKGQVS
ncbi:hypothetical protein MD484_g4868, partial [Candolleomyces efflorescens]